MKNSEVILILEAGFPAVTTHALNAQDAYKVYKIKKAMLTIGKAIMASEDAFFEEAGITDMRAFNMRLADLRRKGPSAELAQEEDKLRRYNELRQVMMNEEADIPEINPIPYESWRKLQDENKSKQVNGKETDILSGDIEMLLEGVLWASPKED